MAHFAKFDQYACGALLAHYARVPEARGFGRNIDRTRTHLNFNLAPDRGNPTRYVHDRIESLDLKRKPRKDAVRLVDCCLTLPQSFNPLMADDFFAAAYGSLEARFGRDNVVSAWVHMDESQPHMHFAFVPVTEDGRLSAKSILNRQMLSRFHAELQVELEDALGVPCEVLLSDETRGDRAWKYTDMDEFKAATARRESVRRATNELEKGAAELGAEVQSAKESIAGSAQTLSEARGDAERERELGEELQRLRERNRALENERNELERDVCELERDVRGVRERLGDLKRRVKIALYRAGRIPDTLSRVTQQLARKMGVEVFNPRSIDYVVAASAHLWKRTRSNGAEPEAHRRNRRQIKGGDERA